MMKNIFQIIVGIFFILSLSACSGTPPKPYDITLNKHSSVIATDEKQALLTYNIKKLHNNFKYHMYKTHYKHSGYSKVNNNSLHFDIWVYDTPFPFNIYYAYEFKYDENSNRLFMIDKSHRKIKGKNQNYDAYFVAEPKGLTKYINDFQTKLTYSYESSLAKYEIHKKEYNTLKPEFDKKYKQIKITTEDTTKIVPSEIIKKLSKYQLWPNEETAFNSYIKGKNISFKIGSRVLKAKEGRYKVDYEKYKYMEDYKKFPANLTYKINKVQYNYLPNSFISKDKNIQIEVLNNAKYADGNSMNSFKITNNTKEFIEINTIAGYHGEGVFDNILNVDSIRLAPMSYKIIKKGVIQDFPSKKLIRVTDKDQKVNYGFSISYKMINQNIVKNLYKVNAYTISSLSK